VRRWVSLGLLLWLENNIEIAAGLCYALRLSQFVMLFGLAAAQ